MRQPSSKVLRAALYGLAATLLTLGTTFLQAQTFRGGINGTVIDHTGALIANATVVALQTETGSSHTTTTSSAGEFLFQHLCERIGNRSGEGVYCNHRNVFFPPASESKLALPPVAIKSSRLLFAVLAFPTDLDGSFRWTIQELCIGSKFRRSAGSELGRGVTPAWTR